jgi:hypothetical protein
VSQRDRWTGDDRSARENLVGLTIPVVDEQLIAMIVVARPRTRAYPLDRYPLLFSWSVKGIWPRLGTNPARRSYVDGTSSILDRARELAVALRPAGRWGAGGVLHVHAEGIDLLATGRRLLDFDRRRSSRSRAIDRLLGGPISGRRLTA